MKIKTLSIKNQLEIISLYNNYNQVKNIAAKFNISVPNLRYWLRHRKEVNWRGKKRLSVNENYFDDINTSNKAYIIGFISADGSVDNEKRPGISIQIQARDKQILEEIKKEMEYKGEIKDSEKMTPKSGLRKYSRLRICSKYLSEKLTSYGVAPRKTYKFALPSCINESNFRYFLRGYFDGDGCLYINPNVGKSCGPRYAVTLVCETSFSHQLQKKLYELLNIKFRFVKAKSTIITPLVIDSALPVEKFMDWLYEGEKSMWLKRKYETYMVMKKLRRTRNNLTKRALTPEKVKEIRNLLKTSISINKVSKQFQVNRSVIKSIKDNTGYLDIIHNVP